MSREGALWIGGLEPYMDEDFLKHALELMGEEGVVSIKVIKNKFTGEPASYGFINFDSDPSALMAMHKLNGKIIPNSQPPVRFQLNHASAKRSGNSYSDREYSIWISGLTADVTDDLLRKTFSSRYESVKSARVVSEGADRKYGFIRFADHNDQREALIHMNGFLGLGEKPLKISIAVPKPGLSEAASSGNNDAYSNPSYSQYYEQYWADRGAWGNYGAYQGPQQKFASTAAQANPFGLGGPSGAMPARPVLLSAQAASQAQDVDFNEEELEGDEEKIVDHDLPINIDSMNSEFIARSQEVWDAIEKDRWLYNLDNDEGFVPNFKKSGGHD